MKRFVINRHGRIVFPFNFIPTLDVSLFDTLEDFEAVVRRDFEQKARSEVDIVARCDSGAYARRYELLRDVAAHLLWTDRYAMTLYEKRPTRWRDVPRQRDDVFLCVACSVDATAATTAIELAYRAVPPAWDESTEHTIFGLLLDVFRNRRGGESPPEAIARTVATGLGDPRTLVLEILAHEPDYPRYRHEDIVGYHHPVPELEALMRHAMVLHNAFPWDRERARLTPVGELDDDAVVLLLHPRSAEVARLVARARERSTCQRLRLVAAEARPAAAPVAPVNVRERFTVMPRLEALAVCRGEHVCSNEDLIRNAAYCWSPMTVDDIRTKTGIEQRTYTTLSLEELSLRAAQEALAKCRRWPDEVGAVLFCSCTSTRMMPSVATWLSAQLGMLQTHASCDLVAACAGLPYAVAEAIRLLEETQRPVLIVAGEKFSDKIGTVRASRLLFGDAAAALVIGPAPRGTAPDVEIFQTYASGPVSEVESIIWPNPEFDNDLTVYGPEVRALVKRYLDQMLTELTALPHPDGGAGSLLDAIDLVVPHQANKTMVTTLAQAVGLSPERLYFDIERVGNTSSASIPVALQDAVRDGVITRPTRVFAPGFGAGAVAGYVVVQVDPAVVV